MRVRVDVDVVAVVMTAVSCCLFSLSSLCIPSRECAVSPRLSSCCCCALLLLRLVHSHVCTACVCVCVCVCVLNVESCHCRDLVVYALSLFHWYGV